MLHCPLFNEDYRPLFSGHETFPLRYGWLKKAYDAVAAERDTANNKRIFRDDSAIARFGVGKNMVASMRHWASCTGIIEEDSASGQLATTNVGDFLFGAEGVDPYLENPAALWYLHWLLCSGEPVRPVKTTWFWVFNHFTAVNFRREDIIDGLLKLAEERSWRRISRMTIRRDVECFIRMYELRSAGNDDNAEEALESPFSELGLIRGLHGFYHLVRGPKPTLPNGVFVVALNSFWNRLGTSRTLSFEMLAHESGSPGRVFLLDESELGDRLLALEDATRGAFRWSETVGIKQVLRNRTISEEECAAFLRKEFETAAAPGVAL